jgi:rhodanese-related sulfurtransferase
MKRKPAAIAAYVVVGLLAASAAGYIYLGPPGTQSGVAAAKFQSVSPLEAKKLIETCPDLQLIDVRSPQEFREGALPGSRLIPFWDFTKGNYDLPKDKPILLVCAVGGRSLAVGQLLATQGFREVYNLKGGLDAWIAQRVPLPARPGR